MSKTKSAALYEFFGSFGLAAYPETNVPDDVKLPYLTYSSALSSFESGEVTGAINLWYYTNSESLPNAKADQICKAIGREGTLIKCDDGVIWIKPGNPLVQAFNDDGNKNVKRRYINIVLEFLTI